MTPISFTTTLFTINDWTILLLPKEASAQLPSRGQVVVTGTLNDVPFTTPLEPDGRWRHWFRVDDALLKAAHTATGKDVQVAVTVSKTWPEPAVPNDLQKALTAHPKAHELWRQVTPMARWEWVRWVRSTGSSETRQRRIEVACSKLEHGERRPCCWNRNLCTEPSVSRGGVLLEPAKADTV